LHLAQTSNRRTYGDGGRRRQRVRPTGDDFTTRFAFPNADTSSLDVVFSTKGTMIRAVLTDFDLLDQLSECTTVTRTVLSGDSDFFGAFSHFVLFYIEGSNEKKEKRNG
jgi:hypothetical protein